MNDDPHTGIPQIDALIDAADLKRCEGWRLAVVAAAEGTVADAEGTVADARHTGLAEQQRSEATVKTRPVHAFTKLDVDDRTAAVTVALERGLLRLNGPQSAR